jgi:tRNA1Val (adenine37-N6)-methyltransferase
MRSSGTDAVLLTPGQTRKNLFYSRHRALGVIALMMAQRFSQAQVDAIEIEDAAQTGDHKFENSPWRPLVYYHAAFQEFL